MTKSAPEDNPRMHEASRREKLRRLIELGVDPWGERFDDRAAIGDIRARSGEIVFQAEDGEPLALPDLEGEEDFDFRAWLAEQGKGELIGPTVRAAGRQRLGDLCAQP